MAVTWLSTAATPTPARPPPPKSTLRLRVSTQSNLTLTFTINGVPTGATCPGASGAANANMVAGANAEISASYPCTLIFFSAYGSSPSTTCNIKAAVVEVIQ